MRHILDPVKEEKVIYVEQQKPRSQIIVKKKEIPRTLLGRLRQLHNTTMNSKSKDGRINYGTDENGKILSHSVSQYSKGFWQNIEEGIKPVVEALHNKLYLTISSCAGHNKISRRFVAILVSSMEYAEFIIKELGEMSFVKYDVFHCSQYMNQDLDINQKTNRIEDIKRKELSADNLMSVTTLNAMCHRGYSDYYVLEVIIGKEIEQEDPWYTRLSLKFFKIFLEDWWTKRLIKRINSDSFHHYYE